GNANWGVKMHVPLWYRNERSAETFEIRVDGEALVSNDVNSGSFGIFITEGNTGELIINWDSTGYPNGEHQITITVFDTDGYRVSSEPGNLGPFFVEEYGTPIETTINVTIEGRNVCGDADGSSAVDIDDVVYLINYIFAGGPEPVPYWTGDADGSTAIDIDDVVYLINYIFSGGPAPVC
ncbi:dockerin type I repeat-containing protein, partial [Candidatus Micrarchaeota archaeon]|nr:dockerin type I repeat-containing protein [Candidatus Micrarchaeota archaeon]